MPFAHRQFAKDRQEHLRLLALVEAVQWRRCSADQLADRDGDATTIAMSRAVGS